MLKILRWVSFKKQHFRVIDSLSCFMFSPCVLLNMSSEKLCCHTDDLASIWAPLSTVRSSVAAFAQTSIWHAGRGINASVPEVQKQKTNLKKTSRHSDLEHIYISCSVIFHFLQLDQKVLWRIRADCRAGGPRVKVGLQQTWAQRHGPSKGRWRLDEQPPLPPTGLCDHSGGHEKKKKCFFFNQTRCSDYWDPHGGSVVLVWTSSLANFRQITHATPFYNNTRRAGLKD